MKSIMRKLSILVVASLLVGCGGGGNGGASTGRLSLTVIWPLKSRLIPVASNSIKAVLTSGQTAVGSQILTRPFTGNQSQVTFSNLEPGTVTLTGTAFPNADATGVAQASGAAPVTIVSGQITQVTVTMASTIDHLTITPVNPTINVGAIQPLIMTAYDIQNNVVLTAQQNISWNSGTPANATITSAGTVTGIKAGGSLITVSESESGKSASTTVTVVAQLPNTGPDRSAADLTGSFLYVLDALSKTISQFKINADGTLTPLSPAAVSVGLTPVSILVDPAPGSHFLYVGGSNNTNGAIYQFNINADGTLTPINPSPPATAQPSELTADPAGKFLFGIDHNDGIRQYIINVDGTLTQNGPDFNDGFQRFASVISTDAKFLYSSAGQGGGIQQFKINANGTLTFMGSNTASQFVSWGMSLNPTAPYIYSCFGSVGGGGISIYTINQDGSLTKNGPDVPFSLFANRCAITPDGHNLYVAASNTPNNVVAQYAINPDGTITPLSPPTVTAGTFTSSVTISPGGKFAYVTNSNDGTISQFKINANGTLTPLVPASIHG